MFRKLILCLLSLCLSNSLNATDQDALQELGQYHRIDVLGQCNRYRDLFKAMGPINSYADIEKASLCPVPGLLDVFKDGVMIVRDYIHNNPTKSENFNNLYLSDLGDLWNLANQVTEQEKLSASTFIFLNRGLAFLAGKYKGEVEGDNIAIEKVKSLLKGKSAYTNRLTFIIYANPDPAIKKRGLLPSTFVREYSNEKLPACLALFDILCEPRQIPTKKDAHLSGFNGVHEMLNHDLTHIGLIQLAEENDWKLANFSKEAGKCIQLLRQQTIDAEKAKAKLLENGDFMLFHEYPLPNMKNDSLKKKAQKLINLVDYTKEYWSKENGKDASGRTCYKRNRRDWEFILKTSQDQDGNTFLPMIQINKDKWRAFPIAKNGNDYVVIKAPEEFENGMEYVISHKDVPNYIMNQRLELLRPAIKEGYEKFWQRFLEIAEGAGISY